MHNCFYYASENPHQIHEKELKSKAVTIWAMISYHHGITHYVFDGTVNREKYANLLESTVFPFFSRRCHIPRIYQQDGAPAHWSLQVRDLLNNNLRNSWTGRDGLINWPPRSPDLSINDFWLWGYVRDNVYKQPRSLTLEHLANRICDFLDSIPDQMVKNSFQSFNERCQKCVEAEGAHFQQL